MNQDFISTLFPCLETKRLVLRQTTNEDIAEVFAIFSDPKTTQFHNLDTFTHINQALEVIEQRAMGFKNKYGICFMCLGLVVLTYLKIFLVHNLFPKY